jgi:hypothetical protein
MMIGCDNKDGNELSAHNSDRATTRSWLTDNFDDCIRLEHS